MPKPISVQESCICIASKVIDEEKKRVKADQPIDNHSSQPLISPLTLKMNQGITGGGSGSATGVTIIPPLQNINSQFETNRQESARKEVFRQKLMKNGANNRKNIDINKRSSVVA